MSVFFSFVYLFLFFFCFYFSSIQLLLLITKIDYCFVYALIEIYRWHGPYASMEMLLCYLGFRCAIFSIFLRRILFAKSIRSCWQRRLIAALATRGALRIVLADCCCCIELRGRCARIFFSKIWFSRSICRIFSFVNVALRRVPFLNLPDKTNKREKHPIYKICTHNEIKGARACVRFNLFLLSNLFSCVRRFCIDRMKSMWNKWFKLFKCNDGSSK